MQVAPDEHERLQVRDQHVLVDESDSEVWSSNHQVRGLDKVDVRLQIARFESHVHLGGSLSCFMPIGSSNTVFGRTLIKEPLHISSWIVRDQEDDPYHSSGDQHELAD